MQESVVQMDVDQYFVPPATTPLVLLSTLLVLLPPPGYTSLKKESGDQGILLGYTPGILNFLLLLPNSSYVFAGISMVIYINFFHKNSLNFQL